MNPKDDTVSAPTDEMNTAVQLALLNQKVGIVIDGHDKRITSLERWRESRGRNGAAVAAPYIAGAAVIVGIASMVVWR